MRAYFFVNSALSGIQKGIQVAHCVAELSQKYADIESYAWMRKYFNIFHEWSRQHKTIIVLEGGFQADLREIWKILDSRKAGGEYEFPYPHAAFNEDEETMNGMMTCVGIILPERIYEAAKAVREHQCKWVSSDTGEGSYKIGFRKFAMPQGGWSDLFTDWEVELITLLNSCPLARN